MIGPEKPPLCAILCSESTPQKRRGSEGPFGIDSMKAAENCGDIQTLPTRQKKKPGNPVFSRVFGLFYFPGEKTKYIFLLLSFPFAGGKGGGINYGRSVWDAYFLFHS